MRRYWQVLWIAVSLSLVALPAAAQEELDPEAAGVRVDAAELRRLIESEPPPGLLYQDLDAFYRRQIQAARILFRPADEERIARRWVEKVPDNYVARAYLWAAVVGRNARWDEGLRLGEGVLAETVRPSVRARFAVGLAHHYRLAGQPERANALMREAEQIVDSGFSGWRPRQPLQDEEFQSHYAVMSLRVAQCRVALEQERIDVAVERCTQADEAGRKTLTARFLPAVRIDAAMAHFHAVMTMARVQLRAGRPFDAEETARRAATLAKGYGLDRRGRLGVAAFIVDSRLARHDYAGAERAWQQVTRQMGQDDPTVVPGGFRLDVERAYVQVLVGQSRWGEALERLDALDRRVADNEFAQRQALNLHARALTWVMGGRAAQAEALLAEALVRDEASFGADHLATGFTRGLLGLALASDPRDPVRLARARAELDRAVASLMAPSGLDESYSDAGLRRLYRRLILERYLELATEGAPDRATIARTFQVADFLRGSRVQRALADAAARNATTDPALAELVRRDQDAANELGSLVGALSQRGPARSDDSAVSTARARIGELERVRAGLRAEIARRFPEYHRLVHPQPPTPDEVAARLQEREAFVALLPTARHVHVWVVVRGRLAYHRADLGIEALNGLVQRALRTLDVAGVGPGMPAFDAEAGWRLYEALLKPVEGAWQGAQELVFAPGGSLGQLPTAVWLTAPWRPGSPTQAPWLVRQAASSQVASASAWVALSALARVRPATEALAAWADPQFDRAAVAAAPSATRTLLSTRASTSANEGDGAAPGFTYGQIPPLPETRQEVEAIATSLGAGAERDLFLGARATRASVLEGNRSGLLQRKRVIVFATHGLAPGDLPNLTQPALAMAADGSEQRDPLAPLLRLEDVLGLKLNADWVLLSACNTASADGQAEEALSGLARGFFYAGSRSLLVTHWAVETESAKALTTGTLAHHAQHPQASKAESLRQAMLQVMAQPRFAHPAFWAPYALVGDGRR
jgi:CHAT domain-containing protein